MVASSDHFKEIFIKYQLKNTVIEGRLDQNISFSVTVLKHCSVMWGIMGNLVLKINIIPERTGHNA